MSYEDSYDGFLNRDSLSVDLSMGGGITEANSSAAITPGSVGYEQTTLNTLNGSEEFKSSNFVTGSSGWRIDGDGNCEFSNGIFRGALSASTIDIGGSDATSFHVDINGNMWLGAATFDITTNPFAVSNAGVIRAVSGTIGGWTLGTNDLKDTAGTVGLSSAVTVDDDIRFWAGHVTPLSAPFRVTESGALTATSATISGSITATTGTIGGWTIGATALTATGITISSAGDASIAIGTTPPTSPTVGTGIFINKTGLFGLNANTQNFKIDATNGNITSIAGTIGGFTLSSTALYAGTTATRIQLDTTSGIHLGATAFADAPFRVSLAGALVATSATITGAITASSGSIGSFTIGTYLYTGTKTAYNDTNAGVHLGSDGIGIANNLFTVSAAGAINAVSGTIAGWTLSTTAISTGAFQTLNTMYFGTSGLSLSNVFSVTSAGLLTATSGSISGWTIDATSIKDAAGTVGLSSAITAGDDIRFWAGHITPASAPFSVTEAGALVATSATISGSITATTGAIGGWTIGATSLYSSTNIILDSSNKALYINSATFGQAGIQLEYNTGTPRAYIGNGSTKFFNFDGTNISWGAVASTLSTAGLLTTTSANIGGWLVDSTTIKDNATLASAKIVLDSSSGQVRVGVSTGNYVLIDGANLRVRSSNYASGVFGAGFTLEPDLLEVGNIACRGLVRTAVFQKDVVSVVGGNLAVLDGDVLDTTMTALDTCTMTTKATTTFTVGDILRIKDGVDDEWLVAGLIDSYPISNYNSGTSLSSDAAHSKYFGQSFSNKNACTLDSCRLYLWKVGAPTGNAVVKIYAHTGVYGTSSTPTGSVLATSDNFDVSTLSTTTVSLKTFTFSGANRITLAANTYYCLELYYTGGDINNKVVIAIDSTSPTHGGNPSYSLADPVVAWSVTTSWDTIFYIFGDNVGGGVYNVKRDMAEVYTADTNPTWQKGATIVNYGQSGEGGLYMTASDTNAPYMSIFTHAGVPWTTITQRVRLGNLTGITDTVFGALSGYGLWTDNIYLKGAVNASSGRISGAFSILGALSIGTAGSIGSGQTAYDTGNGFWLEYNAATPRFSLGNSAGNKMTWDGAALAVVGAITADTGYLGGSASGWTITTSKLYGGSGSAFSGMIQGTGTTKSFFAGATDNAGTAAKFYVTAAGDLTATSATIAGYKLFEAVVAADGSGDYTTVAAALTADETRIFVRNGTYTGESRWNLDTAGTIIQGESRDGVNITFATDHVANPGAENCIYVTNSATLSALTLNSFDFTGSDVKVFDVFPGIIAVSKWAETDPSSLINPYSSAYGIESGCEITIPHDGSRALWSTKLQSVATVTSGLAVFQSGFQWTDGGANEAIISIGLYVDANNYAVFRSRATAGGSIVKCIIQQGGVEQYSYVTAFDASDKSYWKITYDISTHDIKFYGGTSQQGTTQNFDLGSTVYAVASFADEAAYTNCDSIIITDIFLTNSDFSGTRPFVYQNLINVTTTSKCLFENLNLKNQRGRCFYSASNSYSIARDIYFDYSSASDPSYCAAFYGTDYWNISDCFIDATTLPIASSYITFITDVNYSILSNIRIVSGVQDVIWQLGDNDSLFTNCYFKFQELYILSSFNGCTFQTNTYAAAGYFISVAASEVSIRNSFFLSNETDNLLICYYANTCITGNSFHEGKKIMLGTDATSKSGIQFTGNSWVGSYDAGAMDLQIHAEAHNTLVTSNTIRCTSITGSTPTITNSGTDSIVEHNQLYT